MEQTSNVKIKAIIGLGNPSEEYKNTYHNVGNIVLDHLFPDAIFETPSKKHFEFSKQKDLILAKPLTFMNESGRAVKEIIDYFELKPEEIVIIHDDSDMTVGNYKISFDQRSAGHKGVQSIIDSIKTQNFTRIKIGIRPEEEVVRKKAEEFVLKTISKKDLGILEDVFEKIELEIKNLI